MIQMGGIFHRSPTSNWAHFSWKDTIFLNLNDSSRECTVQLSIDCSFYYSHLIFFLLIIMCLWIFLNVVRVKVIIFILNPNSKSLSWSFNMVSEPGLAGGLGFVSSLCNLFLIY